MRFAAVDDIVGSATTSTREAVTRVGVGAGAGNSINNVGMAQSSARFHKDISIGPSLTSLLGPAHRDILPAEKPCTMPC